MKSLLIGLLALASSSVFAVDYLQETALTLENDYQMKCIATSNSSLNCHDKDSKLVGVKVEIRGAKNDGVSIELNDINSSKSALLSTNRANDSRFWGRKLVLNLITKIESSYSADCAELHENFIGKKQEYVFKPWWNEVVRTECMDAKGQGLKLKANIGQDGNFLKSVTIF